jgi:hypothetical protein
VRGRSRSIVSSNTSPPPRRKRDRLAEILHKVSFISLPLFELLKLFSASIYFTIKYITNSVMDPALDIT